MKNEINRRRYILSILFVTLSTLLIFTGVHAQEEKTIRSFHGTLAESLNLPEDDPSLINFFWVRSLDNGIEFRLDQVRLDGNKFSYSMIVGGELPENANAVHFTGEKIEIDGEPAKISAWHGSSKILDAELPAILYTNTFELEEPVALDRVRFVSLSMSEMNIAQMDGENEIGSETFEGPWSFDFEAGSSGRFLADHFGVPGDAPYIKTIGETIQVSDGLTFTLDQVILEKNKFNYTYTVKTDSLLDSGEFPSYDFMDRWFVDGVVVREDSNRSYIYFEETDKNAIHLIRSFDIYPDANEDLKETNHFELILDGIQEYGHGFPSAIIGPWKIDFDISREEMLLDKLDFQLEQQFTLDDIYYRLDRLELSPIDKSLTVLTEQPKEPEYEGIELRGGGWGGEGGGNQGRLAGFKLITDDGSEYELTCVGIWGNTGKYSDNGYVLYETGANYYEKLKDSETFRLVPYIVPEGEEDKATNRLEDAEPWEEQAITFGLDGKVIESSGK